MPFFGKGLLPSDPLSLYQFYQHLWGLCLLKEILSDVLIDSVKDFDLILRLDTASFTAIDSVRFAEVTNGEGILMKAPIEGIKLLSNTY